MSKPYDNGSDDTYPEDVAEEFSSCCSSSVINPSGEGNEGVCADCKEHCSIVRTIPVKHEEDKFGFGGRLFKVIKGKKLHLIWIPF